MLEQVNRNIKYLGAQIAKTAIAEMREVSYKLIEEQTKAKMLAEASPEYAFVTVSQVMLPEEESNLKGALICILGKLLGKKCLNLGAIDGCFWWINGMHTRNLVARETVAHSCSTNTAVF